MWKNNQGNMPQTNVVQKNQLYQLNASAYRRNNLQVEQYKLRKTQTGGNKLRKTQLETGGTE